MMYEHALQHWPGCKQVTHAILKDGESLMVVNCMEEGTARETEVGEILDEVVAQKNKEMQS